MVRENMFFAFNELTVELTTDSSYLGQGAGRRVITGGEGNHLPAHNISLGGDMKNLLWVMFLVSWRSNFCHFHSSKTFQKCSFDFEHEGHPHGTIGTYLKSWSFGKQRKVKKSKVF